MGKVYRCSDAKKMITKWSKDLHNWKCCPRIVGRGNKTIVDGAGYLAERFHRKSTSKVTFKVKLTSSPIVQGLLVVPEDSRVKLSRLMERKTLRASSA